MAASKQETNLRKETSAALSYLLGPITGVLFFVLDNDKFVRFHAMQSIVVFTGLVVLSTLLGFTIVLAPLISLLWVTGFVLWLVLIYKAWQGEEFELPFIGSFVRKLIKKA